MNEPWELRTNDERIEDTLATFIIFCEDENYEPLYLRSFQGKGKLKINAIGNQKQKKLNLNNAIQACKKLDLIVFEDNCYKVQNNISEVIWCIYDRDLEFEDLNLISEQSNIDFDTSIQTAQSTGIKVAWSNDVFELWILLHFELVPQDSMLHRSYIYSRLTEIFKSITPRSPELDELTSKTTFNYKANLKRREAFITHVIPALHARTIIAIENAKILEEKFSADIPYHQRNPCTMVHHLIEEISAYIS